MAMPRGINAANRNRRKSKARIDFSDRGPIAAARKYLQGTGHTGTARAHLQRLWPVNGIIKAECRTVSVLKLHCHADHNALAMLIIGTNLGLIIGKKSSIGADFAAYARTKQSGIASCVRNICNKCATAQTGQ